MFLRGNNNFNQKLLKLSHNVTVLSLILCIINNDQNLISESTNIDRKVTIKTDPIYV